jgi:glyceraldehyde 3-phosphate dehydrogenase (phosphorylating)
VASTLPAKREPTRSVDDTATIVNGDRCVLYVWYDNEFGYSMQVVRVVQKMAGVSYVTLP